tara:strand:+ start:326 stop:700 length:375 start_codon:yes stop_codon:yes gene_type:complete
MSINDVQNELTKIKKNVSNDEKSENEQSDITYILKKNIANLESFVEGKVINMYARPWNKLEPKLKRTKISQYLQEELDRKEISLIQFNNLIYQLHKEIEFNRKLNVKYDQEKCVITEFDYKHYL